MIVAMATTFLAASSVSSVALPSLEVPEEVAMVVAEVMAAIVAMTTDEAVIDMMIADLLLVVVAAAEAAVVAVTEVAAVNVTNAFNPFVSTMIATASEDCYVKVSQFPVGGPVEAINEALVTLEGHEKKATEIKFHPTASNVLGSLSQDHRLKVWDIEKQAEIFNFDFPNEPYHYDWNSDGSQAAVMNKDKKVYVLDPRQPDAATSVEVFAGSKISSCAWMDNHGFLGCFGFTRQSMRQFSIFDAKKMDKPVKTFDVDQSASVVLPMYDPDNSIVYLAGKGDGGIKYFEIVDDAPYAHFLSEFRSNQSQKGVAWVPKRGLDIKKCEIARGLRMISGNQKMVMPVSFTVPRKSDMFQKDIFPDSYAGKPTSTADKYAAGENAAPELMSMNWKDRGDEVEEAVAFVAKKSPAELQKELDAALARIKELEAQLAAK